MTLYAQLPPSLQVRTTPNKGRGLFSSQAARPGTVLASFEPHSTALSTSCLLSHCSYCHREAPLDDTGARRELLRCSGCRIARFCDAECQRKAWTVDEHKEECKALQRMKKAGAASDDAKFGFTAVPDTPVRALARLLWRRSGRDEAWWTEIESLQSHRPQMDEKAMQLVGNLAQQLAFLVGPEVVRSLPSAAALLDLCCSLGSNVREAMSTIWSRTLSLVQSFSLTLPDLSNIGVCLCPAAALSNHDCSPNAVVTFPQARKSKLQIIAIRSIQAGDEVCPLLFAEGVLPAQCTDSHRTSRLCRTKHVLIASQSYVDLSLPRFLRQKELLERYFFTCSCSTCSTPPSNDPRQLARCSQTSCLGRMVIKDVDKLRSMHVICPKCELKVEVSTKVVDVIRSTKMEGLEQANPSDISKRIKQLEPVLCDTSHPLFALLRAAQDHTLASGSPAALSIASRVAGAMEQLFDRGHPVRAVQYATVGKLMLNSSTPSPEAVYVLRKALEEMEIGFGRGGGESGEQVKSMLADCESWMRAGGAQARSSR